MGVSINGLALSVSVWVTIFEPLAQCKLRLLSRKDAERLQPQDWINDMYVEKINSDGSVELAVQLEWAGDGPEPLPMVVEEEGSKHPSSLPEEGSRDSRSMLVESSPIEASAQGEQSDSITSAIYNPQLAGSSETSARQAHGRVPVTMSARPD